MANSGMHIVIPALCMIDNLLSDSLILTMLDLCAVSRVRTTSHQYDESPASCPEPNNQYVFVDVADSFEKTRTKGLDFVT